MDDTHRRDRYDSRALEVARYAAQRGLLKTAVHATTTLHVVDVERLDNLDGPFVLVANHSSHLDAPAILSALPWRLAKRLAVGAAADYFFEVWWRRGLTTLFFNAFSVVRGRGKRHTVSSRELLGRGIPLLLFPEGTRSRTGEMGTFRPGAAALAISNRVPMLPVAIIGAFQAHPRGSNWPKPGRLPVVVAFGDPIMPLDAEAADQLTARVRGTIEAMQQHHAALPPITENP